MEQILNIIRRLLKKDNLNLSDNFFEVGGSSIKSLILTSEIEKLYGISISVAEIYECRTIGRIISLIENRNNGIRIKNDNSFFYFNDVDGSKSNLFMIPPVVGTSIIYNKIATQVENIFNPIGIEYPGFYNDIEIVNSFQGMVSIIFERIKQVQEHGTFNILGYSMGGLIGYEISKKIEKELNGEVNLILIDSATEEMLYDIHKEGNPEDVVKEIMDFYKIYLPIEQADHYQSFLRNNINLIKEYKPHEIVKGDFIVFEARNGNYNMSNWIQYTSGSFKKYIVDGDHFSVIDNVDLSSQII